MAVASVLALFLLSPVHLQSLPQEPSTITFVQGNYILALNAPDYETTISYADILGKNPRCPLSCQCVSLLKEFGFFTRGNAKDIQPNSFIPSVGSVIIFGATKTSIYGHVAIVVEIRDNQLLIFERNFEGCCVDSYRWVSVHQLNIKGYLTRTN